MKDLQEIATKVRWDVVQMSYSGKAPHLGSSLSLVEILVTLYWRFLCIDPTQPKLPQRDRFILSKGHAISALYSVLAQKGFFLKEELNYFNQSGSALPEHPTPFCVPGLEFATGSLGHGLGVGVGLALGAKCRKEKYKTYVLLSDGECNEGSIWEAALFAPVQKLNNLCCIIDFNKWQATGRSEEIFQLSPLKEKWEAFGWRVKEVDGHSFEHLIDAFSSFMISDCPFVIIAHTIKGKGIDFMEDDNNWHYKIVNEEELKMAREILGVPS